MKSIQKMIPYFIFISLLTITIASVATVSSNDAAIDNGMSNDLANAMEQGEEARIIQAMELYAKATPMEQQSPERSKLLKDAESILKAVIKENPKSLDAHRKLMGVYLQMRDYRHAIMTMQSAITLSPEDPKLFIALAILYDHQGAYEYAIPILDQALALDANNKLAQDYKVTIEQKIEQQRVAMESTQSPHQMPPHQMTPHQAAPHSMTSPHAK